MEDRIHAAGSGDALTAAIEAFTNGSKGQTAQSKLYDTLCNLGAEAEEADEFVSLLLQ